MAFVALHTSATGLTAADFQLDVTSNNIANVGTVGYKSAFVTFEELINQALAADDQQPAVSQVGRGVAVQSVTGVFTPGPAEQTGRALDVTVDGDGFLAVAGPNGERAYTRAGNLTVDAAGNLVTADGLRLDPPVTIPPGSTAVTILGDGTVTAVAADGTTAAVGRIGLVRFANPAGLVRLGDTLFAEGGGSGPALAGFPGEDGLGLLVSGALEGSNVDLTTELTTLLVAQRVFASNTQSFSVDSAVLEETANLIEL